MQRVDELISEFIKSFNYEYLNEMFKDISSGKKLRSRLLFNISSNELAPKLAAIIELIHLASLLHDDVIDESKVRRGKVSINEKFGAKDAIMLGDIFYSKAYFELSFLNPKFAQIVSNAVSYLSLGELMDVKLSYDFNTDKEQYVTMIYYKTAILIEATSQIGAILEDFDENDFKNYGKNLGIAFQIVDDILDIVSDEATLGKPALNDFKEGKTTLPYIYLYEAMNETDKEILKSFFKKDLNSEQIFWLKEKFDEFNIIQKSVDEAKKYQQIALNSIKDYKNEFLEQIAVSMVDRKF